MLPVAESVCIMLRVAANHGDEGEGEYNEDQDDLAAGQPELGFSEDLNGEDVEDAVEDDASQRDGPRRNVVAPEVKDGCQGGNLEGD